MSVVMPCFNAEATVRPQLDALARQTWSGRWELVVADNGSTDATLAVVEEFREQLPALQIVDASDIAGAAHARNVGAAHAQGELLAFVDSDDVVALGWLAAMAEALQAHALVASRFEARLLNDEETLQVRSCPQQDGLLTFKYADYLPFASASGLGVRRGVFEALEGFDEAFVNGEDIDLCWRAQEEGYELHFAEDAVLHYRLRSEPGGIFRQNMNYGFWTVPIYKRYRERGMPTVDPRMGLRAWLRLVLRLPDLLHPTGRAKWLRDLAYRWGLVKGSIRYRVLAL